MKNSNKKMSLSIRLMKKSFSYDQCIKEDKQIEPKLKFGGHLILKKVYRNEVSWAKYLKEDLNTLSHMAILFLNVDSCLFAICFGNGHHLLKPNVIQDDFGLITALNALDEKKVKSSDVFIPAEHSKQRRTLTTRGTELYSHDFDNSNHILKNISGKTRI